MERLARRPGDPLLWSRFVQIYGPHVLQWCRDLHLQEADARDVAQEVLLSFWKAVDRFQYDPEKRFRSYLKQLVVWVWQDWKHRRDGKANVTGCGDVQTLLENLPDRESLLTRLDRVFDIELLRLAMRQVQKRVQPQTWEAFKLQAIEGRSGKETAERLGMKLGTVMWARSSVQGMIRTTLRELDRTDDDSEAGRE